MGLNRIILRLTLFSLFFFFLAFLNEKIRDKKISDQSNRQYMELGPCYLQDGKDRRMCLSTVIKSRNKNIRSKSYFFYNSSSNELKQLSGELEDTGFIAINRESVKDFPLAKGLCLNTFLSLDFDEKKIYLSQDNSDSFSYCEYNREYSIIFPESMTIGRVLVAVKKLKSL